MVIVLSKMVATGEVKVATVEVESIDNMATLPVSRSQQGGGGAGNNDPEKSAAIKEMEVKGVQPKPPKRFAKTNA